MRLRFEDFTGRETEWELFALRNAPSSLFQSWAWGEVQKKTGGSVLRFGVYEQSTLVGVFQVTVVRARRGSFLHVRHGPILASRSNGSWRQTLDFLKTLAKRHGCWFIRISPQLEDTPARRDMFAALGLKPAAIHRMDGEYCWVLDLMPSLDELLSGMRKTTRYEIRKGAKDGVEVYSTGDPRYMKDFFDLYKQTSERHSFVPHTGIAEEFEVYAKRGQATLYLGKWQGKIISSAIILYYGNQAIYHHGASLPSKAPVSYAVQWEAIQEAKKRGMKVYNFWGIAPENSPKHPWRGITLFKTGFGGRLVEYLHAYDLPVHPLYWVSRSVESVRRMRKGYD